MSNFLILNQNYVQCGLGTLTYTVPSTITNSPYTVQCQVTFPQAVTQGFGAGSGADQGLGVLGGVPGVGSNNTTPGNGGLGLGFGGSNTDGASGNGSGYGAGSGGGTLGGFSLGGDSANAGAKGLGFGSDDSGYNQPPADTNVPDSVAAILSSLAVLVKKNGVTIYTAPTIAGDQNALQFKTSFLATASDSITVVLSSALADDEALNAIKANVSIAAGE